MRTPSRQALGVNVSDLVTLIWIILFLGILVWFSNILRRIEKTLNEIKEQLETKPSTA